MEPDVVLRTFGYCPIVSVARFDAGFASCARLALNYTAGGPVAAARSVTANVSNAAASAMGRAGACGLVSRPENLSCYFQVSIAPFATPGLHPDLGFYECAPEALEPAPPRFEREMIGAVVIVGLLFLVPNVLLLLVALLRPRGAAAAG